MRGAANTFNELLESDRLKTEVMVLRTKVKTLSDKLALKGTDNTKVLQLEQVIKSQQAELEMVRQECQKHKQEIGNLNQDILTQKGEMTLLQNELSLLKKQLNDEQTDKA